MALSSPRRGWPIMAPDHALEGRIFNAYQEVKRAAATVITPLATAG